MNIQLVNKLKSSVNFFDDAEFVSIVSENEVLVRNTNNGSEWIIPFEITESEKILYKGAEAQCITEAQDDFSEETKHNKNKKDIVEAISTIFEDKDAGIKKLSELIRTLPMISPKTEEVTTESEQPEKELVFFKEFEDKIEEMNLVAEEFMQVGKMFDEDGDVKIDDFYEASAYKEAYEAKLENSKTFFENLEIYKEFYDEVKASFDEEIAQIIIESVDLTKPKDKYGMLISKNLVKFKQDTLTEFDLLEESKKAISIFEDTLSKIDNTSLITENTATDIREQYYSNRFTRFNIGIFKREDLVKINEELTAAMTSFDIESPEDMHYINDLKMKIEYMERANQIDDEMVVNILNEFNTKFGHDKSAQYRDESRGMGWKAPDRQKVTSLDISGI